MTHQRALVSLNPLSLSFISFRAKYSDKADYKDIAYEMLRNFSLSFAGCDPVQLVIERAERTDQNDFLKIVPADELIIDKLIQPLIEARICFCLGHYAACIAMAGTACEMTSLFIHELIDPEKASSWTGQGKRLKQLEKFPEVPKDFLTNAETVRDVRNKYMHLLDRPKTDEEEDANLALWSALRAIDSLLDLKPTDVPGVLGLNVTPVKNYLRENGVITDILSGEVPQDS
ncbi:MAG: hypothetical protein SFY67_10375 [Candidatus Melainabacteria bacterium]|nr:hypothetical protein [Candidatus Melainabacteria bacterium]